jgi:hypothetical protein
MDFFIKLSAFAIGVFLYSCLLEWLRSRRARTQRTSGQSSRQKAYLFGRKLALWISR